MQIWILNPFDELPGEGPEQRYACLARHLLARGHTVTWITADFHHRLKQRRLPPADLPPGLDVLLVRSPAYPRNTSPRRLRAHRVWARNARTLLLQQVRSGERPPPNLVLASTPPIEGAATALKLAEALGASSVVDVMDRWPDNWLLLLPSFPALQFLGRLLLSPWFRLTREVFRKADALCAQSRAFADFASQSTTQNPQPTPHPSPCHICPLGAPPPAHPPSPAPPPFPLHILYVGAMGAIYDIGTVLGAMKRAQREERDWRLTLVGTDPENTWRRRAKEMGLGDRVTFPGYVHGGDLESLLNTAHLGLVPLNPASGVAIPYKVGNYL